MHFGRVGILAGNSCTQLRRDDPQFVIRSLHDETKSSPWSEGVDEVSLAGCRIRNRQRVDPISPTHDFIVPIRSLIGSSPIASSRLVERSVDAFEPLLTNSTSVGSLVSC